MKNLSIKALNIETWKDFERLAVTVQKVTQESSQSSKKGIDSP